MNGQSDADLIKERELRSPEQGQLEPNDPEVGYLTSEHGPFECQRCVNYIDPQACSKVAGQIDPKGCCNLFSSIESNEPEELTNEGTY